MLIPRRLAVWFIETVSEALLFGVVLAVLLGYDQNVFVKDVLIYSSGILLVSFTTGYLLTTAIARGAWKGQKWWSYSVVAVALFLVHSQIFFVISGGSTRSEKLLMRIAGACIVFVCTFAGTLALRHWKVASSESATSQP